MNGKAPGRRPDFNATAMDKRTDLKGPIGAAWVDDDGTITLKLNSFVVLDSTRGDYVIKLWKNDGRRKDPPPAIGGSDDDRPPY